MGLKQRTGIKQRKLTVEQDNAKVGRERNRKREKNYFERVRK